jgi:arylsulfatase/arylsulfatase A
VLLGNHATADSVTRVYAMVENIDDNVGRLTAALERLNVAENTIVIFMCDNGPNTRRFVGEVRGMKSEVLEGGVRSPFIVAWPGRIRPGSRSDRIAAHIDVLPTLLAAAGVEPPRDVQLDGRNLLPLLVEQNAPWNDRTLFLQSHRGLPVASHQMAALDQRWKLTRPSGFDRDAPAADAPFELYDLASDPREERNLVQNEPAIAARLRSEYDAWFEAVSQTRPDNFAPPRIIVGTDHEPETTLTRQDWQATDGGWGSQGQWLVRAPAATRFRATVILQAPAAGDATLWINQQRFDKRQAEPTQRLNFEDVDVPAGDAAIRFEIVHGRRSAAPYHIVLTRVEQP